MNKKIKDKKRNKTEAFKKNISTQQFIFFGFLIVLLPLINYNEVFDRALMPQLFALSIFFLLAVLGGFVFFKNHFFDLSEFKNPVVFLLAAYFVLTIVSSIFAFNFKESLFEIVKTFIVLLLLLLSLNLISRNNLRISFLADCFLTAGIIFLVIGFYQYFTLVLAFSEKFLPNGLSTVYLVEGTMEHKNLYSSALFMLLPFLAWGFWKNRGRKRVLYGLTVVATLFMILLLSTRAVWVGTFFAGILMVSVLILKIKQFKLPRSLRIYAIVGIVLVVSSGLVFVLAKGSTANFSVGDRIRSIFDPEASNNKFRLNVWEASLEMWNDNPVIGVGAGNWKLNIPPYLKDYDFKIQEMNWLRPHNDFLWVLTEKGIIGLVIYLSLFLVSFLYLFQIINGANKMEYKVLALLIMGGMAGYLVLSFFDFPSERVYHQTVLAIWLATIVSMKTVIVSANTKTQMRKFSVLGIVSALLVFCVIYSYSAINFEVAVKKTQISMAKKNWPQMFNDAQNIPTRFRNVDTYITPVHHYHGFAKQNMKAYKEASEFYLQALKEHPTKVSVMNNLGIVYYLSGNTEQAKTYLEKALAILPDYNEALINMSQVCSSEGNYKESLEYLRRIPKDKWNERFYQKEKQLINSMNSED